MILVWMTLLRRFILGMFLGGTSFSVDNAGGAFAVPLVILRSVWLQLGFFCMNFLASGCAKRRSAHIFSSYYVKSCGFHMLFYFFGDLSATDSLLEHEVFVNLWHGSNHCYPKEKLQNFYHNNKSEVLLLDEWICSLDDIQYQKLLVRWCMTFIDMDTYEDLIFNLKG